MSRDGQGKAVMEDYTNSDMLYAIEECIHSVRDRGIMKRRLIDGVLFEPLAEEFELSVRQVKNIVYKNQEKLFKRLRIIDKNRASP